MHGNNITLWMSNKQMHSVGVMVVGSSFGGVHLHGLEGVNFTSSEITEQLQNFWSKLQLVSAQHLMIMATVKILNPSTSFNDSKLVAS
jgi:hypothetical protein